MFRHRHHSRPSSRSGMNLGKQRYLRAGSVIHLRLVPILVLAVWSCGGGGNASGNPAAPAGGDTCVGYPDAQTSSYVLPFPVGISAPVFQSNCGPYTHMGGMRYATDFALPVGSVAVAARAGEVVGVREHFRDDIDINRGQSNYVMILHADGTMAYYGHFRQYGVTVEVGDQVAQGQQIGVTGATGYIGPTPHLHIEIQRCQGCETIATTFRNADPPDSGGLIAGTTYTALPY